MVFLDVVGQINGLAILHKQLANYALSHCVDSFEHARSARVLELSTDHLIGQILHVEKSIIVERYGNDVEIQNLPLANILEGLNQQLDHIVRMERSVELS